MTPNKAGIIIEEHSVKDLFGKLDEIIAHQKYTNGKVAENIKQINDIKKRSVSLWIYSNPFKAICFAVLVTLLIISDFRKPILGFLINTLI